MIANYCDVKDEIKLFKFNLIQSRKYWLIYLIIITIISLSTMNLNNYLHPKTEIFVIVLISLLGIFLITFYSYHNTDEKLYKTAFLIILNFGIIFSILTPIASIPDEQEHMIRTEITSQGIIIPEYKNSSYETIQSITDLLNDGNNIWTGNNIWNGTIFTNKNGTIFTNNFDDKPINYAITKESSAFAHNPFYGYIPQAIGMIIAKILNLNTIWLLWLGRICNLITYATLVAIAIKKTPILKIPMIVVSCIPLIVFQVASLSIDSLINGLTILLIAYFFYMYKSPKESITKKQLIIFITITLLLGLCKITSFLLVFLILCVPKSNFKNKNYYYGFLGIILLGIIGILWAKLIINPLQYQSWRLIYNIQNNVNSTKQIHYILSHKKESMIMFASLFKYLNIILDIDWCVFGKIYFFNNLYLMFLGGILLIYPIQKFNIKSKIGVLIILISNYYSIFITFLLNYTPIGQISNIMGVQSRYFLPLYILIPFIFGFNHMKINKEFNMTYIIILTIAFLALVQISLVTQFY